MTLQHDQGGGELHLGELPRGPQPGCPPTLNPLLGTNISTLVGSQADGLNVFSVLVDQDWVDGAVIGSADDCDVQGRHRTTCSVAPAGKVFIPSVRVVV